MSRNAVVISTGIHVPSREVSNDTLRARFDPEVPEFVDKMEERSGIRTRWHAPDDWASSDLALHACRAALATAEVHPEQIDLILLGTDSPDYVTPATSTVLQHKLGATRAGTFDVGCACASFPTALSAAAGLISTHQSIERVLVVGVYLMHRLAADDDPMVFFYGDGAGAALLGAGSAPGFIGASFRADGSYAQRWAILSGGTAEPATEESVREGRTQVRVYERYEPEVNDRGWPILVRQLARDNAFEIEDVDLFIFTQVRRPTIELVMSELGAPLEKTHTVMDKWGYTGSACVPMALHDALRLGKAAAGDLVVLVGSGVGYNQAGAALRLTEDLIVERGKDRG